MILKVLSGLMNNRKPGGTTGVAVGVGVGLTPVADLECKTLTRTAPTPPTIRTSASVTSSAIRSARFCLEGEPIGLVSKDEGDGMPSPGAWRPGLCSRVGAVFRVD